MSEEKEANVGGESAADTVFERIRLDANKVVFDEGQKADAVYVIREGKVTIRVDTLTDHPRTLTTLGKNEVIGELALIEGRVHHASAITSEPTKLVRIAAKEFMRRLLDLDPMMKLVIDDLIHKLHDATDQQSGGR